MLFSGKPRRRLDPLEQIFSLYGAYTTFGVEFDHPSKVTPAIEELIRCNNGFRCKHGLLNIYGGYNEDPLIYKIPSNVTIPQACRWLFDEHCPSPKRSLATIAHDDTRVVLLQSHICMDGARIVDLIHHLTRPEERWTSTTLPLSSTEFFRKEMEAASPLPIVCADDDKISRIFSHQKTKKNPKFCVPEFCVPIEETVCYSKDTHICSGLTEQLWVSATLSNSAFLGELHKNQFGMSTVTNTRKFLPKEMLNNPAVQNFIASIAVHGHPTKNMTLAELGSQMRKDFEMKSKRGDHFGHMKQVWNAVWRPWKAKKGPGIGYELSNVGTVTLKGPITDAWISLLTPDKYGLLAASMTSYSITGHGKNDLHCQLQFNTSELGEQEGKQILHGVEFGLRHLAPSMTVGEALLALQKNIHS